MYVEAGFLKINGCMKPTLYTALLTNFEILCTLKCMVHCLPIIKPIGWLQQLKYEKLTTPQCHLQTLNITEVNKEQKINIRGVNK